MYNPSYLQLSRNGLFYFRWPLPPRLHPLKKQSSIKVSLRTREPRKALRLARTLIHIANSVNEYGLNNGMKYAEVKALLKEHFATLLDREKAKMDTSGPLVGPDKQIMLDRLADTLNAIDKDHGILAQGGPSHPIVMTTFMKKYGVDFADDSKEYAWLEDAMKHAHRDYLKAILDHSDALKAFDFSGVVTQEKGTNGKQRAPETLALGDLASAYTSEKELGKNWGARTKIERLDHIALLKEILGENTDTRSLTAADAKRVKDTLASYPKNRSKNPATKGKSLRAALMVKGIDRIQVPTINKYLQTYADMFEWAKRNSLTDRNLFSGLTVRANKQKTQSSRRAFSNNEIELIIAYVMRDEIRHGRIDYRFWGTMIGIYTGARLNEIAQIKLQDIKYADDIWYIDINEDDDKSLKTIASRRKIPIHKKLIDMGFVSYVEQKRLLGQEGLFVGLTYSPNNGWGRNLGRWFNETVLPALGLKTKELVFHSFRHTVNTRLRQAGAQDALVKAIIGHSQEGVALQNYFSEGFTLGQLNAVMQSLDFNPPAALAAQ